MKIIDLHFYDQKEVIAAYLVETSDGPILMETGPFSTFKHLEKGINEAGYQAAEIKHVFLSHIHLDHAGAAWWFAEQGANIYVHPKGYKHMADPSKLMHSAKRIYQDMMDSLWGAMNPIPESQLYAIEHEKIISIGNTDIQAWHTPGHAVHHIAWQIGGSLYAGDVAGVKIREGSVVPPCPPPDINVEDWSASISLIKTLGINKMYLAHYGEVNDIIPHMDALEKELNHWADWMKPYFENETPPAEITPLFQEMVQNRLRENGVTDEIHMGQYEAANPSWMSVAGLLRYWKKKEE